MAHITLATAYLADDYATPMCSGLGGQILIKPFKYTITAAFVINDLLKLSKLCPGAAPGWLFIGLLLEMPDMDSSTGFVLDLGDSTSATRFVSGSTVGVSAGRISSTDQTATVALKSLPISYTAEDDLVLKVNTAASGTAATSGVIQGYIKFAQLGISSL